MIPHSAACCCSRHDISVFYQQLCTSLSDWSKLLGYFKCPLRVGSGLLPTLSWAIRRSSTNDTGSASLTRYPPSSMSPQWWPRLLTTYCVLTLYVVRKRSENWNGINLHASNIHWVFNGLDFIMNRWNEIYENLYMSVGVLKDYKLRNLHASHTLGWSWNWNTKR